MRVQLNIVVEPVDTGGFTATDDVDIIAIGTTAPMIARNVGKAVEERILKSLKKDDKPGITDAPPEP